MKAQIAGFVFAGVFLIVPAGRSQVPWDSPWLVPVDPAAGFGVFLVEPQGGELGVLGTWRPVGARQGLGLRFGLAGGPGSGNVSGLAGADVTGLLNRASEELPLDIGWLGGVGLGFGDWVIVSLPLGLTLGHTLRGEGVELTPYLTPRVVLDGYFGRGAPGDDLELAFSVDLGVDLRVAPRLTVRFGAGFGDREALGIGVVF